MGLLEERDDIVDHVRALGELILGGAYLVLGEEGGFCEMGKERESEVAIEVRDNRLGEIVVGHGDYTCSTSAVTFSRRERRRVLEI